MVRAEQSELPEKRMLPKVLAGVIHKQIEAEIHKNPKIRGERVPKLSTIEKKVLKYRKQGVFDEDKPWSLASLADHQIAPEALSTILRLWVWMLEEDGLIMSIREAKWAGRFYAAVNEGAANVKEPLKLLSYWARSYATSEMIAEMTGNLPLDMGAAFDSSLWTLVTGKQATLDLANKIFRRPEPNVYTRTTEKEWATSKELNERGGLVNLELYAISEKIAVKQDSSRIGGKNERATKQRQGTKAQRHRQRNTVGQG